MTYTEKELDQFLHGISLSLLSKKSAQHWRYDEETAKEIEWLEALERKVRADKADRKTEPSDSEIPNNCEPQYEMGMGTLKCDNCSEYGSFKCTKCDGEMYFKRLEPKDEPQRDAVGVPMAFIDEAKFKAHCLNCQRDVADIKCLDCDGDKYFLPDEPQPERSE